MIENIIHKFLAFLRKKKIIRRAEAYNHYKIKIDEEIEKISSNIKNYLKGEKICYFITLLFNYVFIRIILFFSSFN